MAACPSCGAGDLAVFYEVLDVPVHDVLLMRTRQAALDHPRGDVRLGFCRRCGFIANTAFDPGLHDYSPECEESQEFSPTFAGFADELARRLVERHAIRGRDVVEIGCGKGDFLRRLCRLGGNRGVGIDPAWAPGRADDDPATSVRFVQALYSEAHADVPADVVCCRHTLEHIAPVAGFMSTLRRTLGRRHDALVFFELPESLRILREGAFWDVYYEHCSYFTPGSLARLFRATGFDVEELELAFDDQYILLLARPAAGPTAPRLPLEDDLPGLARLVESFADAAPQRVAAWRRRLADEAARGRRVAVWGAGSKAVAFLTTLGRDVQVGAIVDINPYKQGMYLPGTGQQVLAPDALVDFDPQLVIAMNPIYRDEIRDDLARRGLHPELVAV